MYQEIHPCRASSIDSVKINTSLVMMWECLLNVCYDNFNKCSSKNLWRRSEMLNFRGKSHGFGHKHLNSIRKFQICFCTWWTRQTCWNFNVLFSHQLFYLLLFLGITAVRSSLLWQVYLLYLGQVLHSVYKSVSWLLFKKGSGSIAFVLILEKTICGNGDEVWKKNNVFW